MPTFILLKYKTMATVFSKIRQAYSLFKEVDFEKLGKLASKVDLKEVMETVGKMDEKQLGQLLKLLNHTSGKHKELPPIEGDFYHLSNILTPDERALQLKVRTFLENEIKPIVNEYWLKAEFPFEIIPKVAALNVCGATYKGYGCPGLSHVMEGVLAMEMARVDTSISTFFGVQSGLAMGSIYLLGSETQKQEWLPDMQQLKKIGAFGLTEPEVGSGAAGGLTVEVKKQGDKWIINGQKKWIGNSTFADVIIIWARDVDDNQVKGFLVRKGNPGMSVEKMEDKMALRIVQNGIINLNQLRSA